ncbi:MAG: prolipoprotein diacylglyceryl transferase, partial [Candidatus Bathyarchaeia archaeon]
SIHHPFEVLPIWHGGMSFHGGLIGVILCAWIFAKIKKFDFFTLTDMLVLSAPIGIGLGRIGNFINGELYGRITNVPWAMVFPEGGPFPRHPSQLYEAGLEGVVLFVILWFLKDKFKSSGVLSSLFLIFYGVFRFFVEFFREPDPQIGYILQTLNIIPVLTARENVALTMTFLGVPKAERQQRAAELLTLVGLGDRLDHRPTELSGGQQQRVAIARSLANNPAIILADEPTGNLDLNTGFAIVQLLYRLKAERGTTIICATHDLKMIDISDRVVFLRDGTVENIEKRRGLVLSAEEFET